MEITKEAVEATAKITTDGGWEIMIPLAPVPASRLRVGRWGTYYPKTYTKWKNEAARLLSRVIYSMCKPTEDAVYVAVHTVTKRPQKLVRRMPRPDVDNYVKAALDAITTAGFVWVDDNQVEVALTTKRYADEGEQPHTYIRVADDMENLLFPPAEDSEDVYALPARFRVSLEELK